MVTADALNCQKAVAEKIRDKGAHYFLAVKGNQSTLFEEVKRFLNNREKMDYFEEINKAHGRLEVRRCWSTEHIDWLKKEHPDWKDLKSICCIERERHIKEKSSKECAFYISSTAASASKHLQYSRQHWAVESMHWVLDVVFNEERSHLQAKNAAQNMAVIRKLVINMIKRYKKATGDDIAIKTTRKAASWSLKIAETVLRYIVTN